MDLKGRTFWEMEKEAISYVRKTENEWVSKSIIAATVANVVQNEQELSAAFKAQDANDPGGHIDQKNGMLTKFFKKIYKLSRKLSFYGKNSNDHVLLNDVSIAETAFDHMAEKKALIKCNTIIKRGIEYLDKASAYDVTADDLESLGAELAILEQMKPTIGVITNDHKSATRSIKDLISEAHVELDKLDDAFEGLIDNDDFIDGWFAIRKIKGRHKPKAQIATEPVVE